ncbi:MAG: ABC transporter ATP-binding protein [Clostridia bacterium]|nr:ABC transporter ATP-binding protein [Clostridia bacterium]
MIKANGLIKKFGHKPVLNGLSCTIPSGCVYGLVGSNGAGKSTLLRLLAGVYKADGGTVEVDGAPVYENPDVKEKCVLVADELYFLPQSNMLRMADLYAAAYPAFDRARFKTLTEAFRLDPKANLSTFSKGMRRQAAIVLSLSCHASYLFIDEAFDGLDPVMRALVKKAVYADMAERGATTVITSHSLRELEDTCDQLALLHQGGILLESEVDNLKTSLFKLQVAFREPFDKTKFSFLAPIDYVQHGSVATLVLRGDRAVATTAMQAMEPILIEMLPLTLEEVFVHEMHVLGYAFDDVIL